MTLGKVPPLRNSESEDRGVQSIEPVLCACLCQPLIASVRVCLEFTCLHMWRPEASLEYCHLSRLGGQLVLKSLCLYFSPSWELLVPLIIFKLFYDFYL